MDYTKFIVGNAIILIPALYIIGAFIKQTDKINNKYIPFILLPLGILGAIGLLGLSVQAVIQGILVTGTAVYTNQLVKQSQKE